VAIRYANAAREQLLVRAMTCDGYGPLRSSGTPEHQTAQAGRLQSVGLPAASCARPWREAEHRGAAALHPLW
jgi:hypothetical protein